MVNEVIGAYGEFQNFSSHFRLSTLSSAAILIFVSTLFLSSIINPTSIHQLNEVGELEMQKAFPFAWGSYFWWNVKILINNFPYESIDFRAEPSDNDFRRYAYSERSAFARSLPTRSLLHATIPSSVVNLSLRSHHWLSKNFKSLAMHRKFDFAGSRTLFLGLHLFTFWSVQKRKEDSKGSGSIWHVMSSEWGEKLQESINVHQEEAFPSHL